MISSYTQTRCLRVYTCAQPALRRSRSRCAFLLSPHCCRFSPSTAPRALSWDNAQRSAAPAPRDATLATAYLPLPAYLMLPAAFSRCLAAPLPLPHIVRVLLSSTSPLSLRASLYQPTWTQHACCRAAFTIWTRTPLLGGAVPLFFRIATVRLDLGSHTGLSTLMDCLPRSRDHIVARFARAAQTAPYRTRFGFAARLPLLLFVTRTYNTAPPTLPSVPCSLSTLTLTFTTPPRGRVCATPAV